MCWNIISYRELILNEEKGMYERYGALFGLRNQGGDEAVAAIIESLNAKSALLRHEVHNMYFSLIFVISYSSFCSLIYFSSISGCICFGTIAK